MGISLVICTTNIYVPAVTQHIHALCKKKKAFAQFGWMSLIKKDIGVLLVCAVVVVWSLRGTGWSGGFYFQDSWAISNSAQHARQL